MSTRTENRLPAIILKISNQDVMPTYKKPLISVVVVSGDSSVLHQCFLNPKNNTYLGHTGISVRCIYVIHLMKWNEYWHE